MTPRVAAALSQLDLVLVTLTPPAPEGEVVYSNIGNEILRAIPGSPSQRQAELRPAAEGLAKSILAAGPRLG